MRESIASKSKVVTRKTGFEGLILLGGLVSCHCSPIEQTKTLECNSRPELESLLVLRWT